MVVPWFQAWQNKIVEPNLSPGRIWSLRLSAYNPLLGCQVNKGTKQEWHCAAARLLNVNLISRTPKNIIKHQKYDPVQHHTASIMDTSDTSDISPGFFFSEMTMKTGRGVTIKPQAGLGPQGEILDFTDLQRGHLSVEWIRNDMYLHVLCFYMLEWIIVINYIVIPCYTMLYQVIPRYTDIYVKREI